MQVVGATEYSQHVEVTERHDDQGCSLDQPPARGKQGEASIDSNEDYEKSSDQDDIEREDEEITRDAKPKEPLLLEGPKGPTKNPKDPKGDPKKPVAALFQPLQDGSRDRGLDRYLIQAKANNFNDTEDRGEEIMNYVLEVLDLDVVYEYTSHTAPYRFDVVVFATEAQMERKILTAMLH